MKIASIILLSFITIHISMCFAQTISDSSMEEYKNKDANKEQVYSPGLTDEEIKLSNTYTNPEYQKRLYDNYCQEHVSECRGLPTYAINAEGDTLVQTAAQMMGIFGFMSQFGYNKKMQVTDQKTGKTETKTETKEATDYCAFIPMAGEMVAMTNQQLGQQVIMSTPTSTSSANIQRESLLKSSRSHDKRAETATIQAGVWGATTACYVAMTANQAMSSSIANWTKGQIANHALKIAASAGLTAFYWYKRQKALDAAELTKSIAAKLGEAGNCNPITEVNCYCAQPETKDDPKYCLPADFKGRTKKGYSLTSCVDSALNTDSTCKCLRTSNCYDMKFQDFPIKFVGTGSVESDPIKPILDLYRGNLDKAGMEKSAQRGLAAGKNKLKEMHPMEGVTLNKNQVPQSKFLQELGLNKEWSDQIAARPMGKDEQNIKKFLQEDAKSWENIGAGAYNSNSSYSGNSLSNASSRYNQALKKNAPNNKNNEESPFDMLNKLNEKKLQQAKMKKFGAAGTPSPYAEKALQEAQLNSDSGKGIFEIIQYRYQLKWPLLQDK